jgi:tRNA pseudouridine55 synthase
VTRASRPASDFLLDGVLVIDKPAGPTSHDVVAVLRRALGIDRIGHTGTLDPLATGVLPLVVGKATRLASFLSSGEKEYIARVRFGASTPTYDAESVQAGSEGTGTGERSTPIVQPPGDRAAVEALLPVFRGTYLQTPPLFSAKKISGTPAYKLARKQKPVEVKSVEVSVRELELRSYTGGLAELRIVCSSGFYVRSLAHDLGQRAGCGAFLEGLQRTRAGDFTLGDAVPLAAVIAEGLAARERLIPMERLLTDLPCVVLNAEGVRRTGHGNALRPQDFGSGNAATWSPGGRVRLLDASGALLGLAEPLSPQHAQGGLLQPVIVLTEGSGVRC